MHMLTCVCPNQPLTDVTALQANLTKDKERELNDAIQAHFREWLQGSSLLRQIYDLSNLERDEVAASGGGQQSSGNGGGGAPGSGLPGMGMLG
jgi:hypothetical protein